MIQLLVLLVVVGVAYYLVDNYVPIAARIKAILHVVVVVAVCVWLLRPTGIVSIPLSFSGL